METYKKRDTQFSVKKVNPYKVKIITLKKLTY